MTEKFVLEFDEIIGIDFSQASIYLDACFILAYLDSRDTRGDKVADILTKWEEDGIASIAISNLTMGEVIHNLLKNHIRNVLLLSYKIEKGNKVKKPYILTLEEKEIIYDMTTAKRLMSLISSEKLEYLIKTGELHYSIDELLKQYKVTFPQHRTPLHEYYNKSVETYVEFTKGLGSVFKIITPSSDFNTQLAAQSFMRIFQLSPYDAFHIALTAENCFDYFATLDSDFVHNYYSNEAIGTAKILKVA